MRKTLIKRPIVKRPKKLKRPAMKPPTNYDLSIRAVTENMWLWRHRQPDQRIEGVRRAGAMSQIDAAKFLGLSRSQYTNLERGEATLIKAAEVGNICRNNVTADISDPTMGELCYLARRRSGWQMKTIVAKLAVSRPDVSSYVYTRAEGLGAEWVRDFWVSEGYRFPVSRAEKAWITRPREAAAPV